MRCLPLLASSLIAGFAMAAAPSPAPAPAQQDEASLERSLDAGVKPDEMRDWLKALAAEPNNVGSPHDKQNADFILSLFKKFGWDAHIETFNVLYPTPVSETVELLGPKPFKATLQEPNIPGDTTSRAKQPSLPAYLEYQGDGDVKAPLVYVNYGMKDDYKALERLGVDVKGKIVIVRYGSGWRGLKPLLAQQHGAVGCLIYSDPSDDGYSVETAYPDGPARPAHGFQRGSVEDMPI
jgi:N-acetylated-alpha-linked acidic dipeptidase